MADVDLFGIKFNTSNKKNNQEMKVSEITEYEFTINQLLEELEIEGNPIYVNKTNEPTNKGKEILTIRIKKEKQK